MAEEKTHGERSLDASIREYGRGLAGGLLFSLPLLYTMEVWWNGFIVSPWLLMLAMGGTFLLLIAYNRYAGMRQDANMLEVVIDSVEEMGIGLVVAAFVLLLLGRIAPDMPMQENMGKIVVEAMAVAVGVSVGTAQLGEGDDDERGMRGDSNDGFFGQLSLAVCGAVLVASNVAPTEEILMIAVEASNWQLLAIALFSITLGGIILHASGMRGGVARLANFKSPMGVIASTAITYTVALGCSAALLAFFGRFQGASLTIILAQSIVLALPATLGGSAGRFLLQT